MGCWLVLSLAVIGCGVGTEADWPLGRPKIDRLEFLQQSAQNPFALRFSILFSDTDGDLGPGHVHLLLNGSKESSLRLEDVFSRQVPPLSMASVTGAFEIVAKIDQDVAAGDRIRVGFVLEDEKGRRSNMPSLVLEADNSGGDS